MNQSLKQYLRCIINGNDTRYTEWSTDVKLFPLSYNSRITTTLGMSPYEMVVNQKSRKPIMFREIKMHKVFVNQTKIQYVSTYHCIRHHHPQFLKLASSTHTEWILNRDKNTKTFIKKLLQRQNINKQTNSRFTPETDIKIGTFVLIPNFTTQKKNF